MAHLDCNFENTVRNTFGERGEQWLAELPAKLESICGQFKLQLQPHYPNLSYNYVAPATQADGREVVLKLGVPGVELHCECAALRRFAGCGCVHLLYSDSSIGLLLLERLLPGNPLTSLANDETDSVATSAVCTVMRSLSVPAADTDADFKSVSALGQGFNRLRTEFPGGTGSFPEKLIGLAERLWLELDGSATAPVLLHGDLHHDNIVSAIRSPWLAIDPKGYIGDPVFETGAILRNLWQGRNNVANPAQTLMRRAAQMADELGYDPCRIRGWAIAQAVLSAWWSYEDGDPNWADSLENAEMICRALGRS